MTFYSIPFPSHIYLLRLVKSRCCSLSRCRARRLLSTREEKSLGRQLLLLGSNLLSTADKEVKRGEMRGWDSKEEEGILN